MSLIDTSRDGRGRRLGLTALAATLLLSAAACSSPEQKVERYTKSGQEFLVKGDHGRANVQFQNALKLNEEYVPALSGLAQIAEERQDFRAMFAILQRIVRLEPGNVDALVKISKLYLIASEETDALETADKALARAPENPDAIAVKAAILLKLEDTAGAVDLANKALSIDPKSPEATTVLATERALAGDQEGALARIEAGLKADPQSDVLQLLRLQVLQNLGRSKEQGEGHQALVANDPENVAYRQLYVSYLIDQDRLKEAREQLVEIVKLSPNKVEPVADVARVDYQLGGAEAARKTFEAYLKDDPKNVDLKFTYAAFLRQEGDHAAAEAIYSEFAKAKEDSLAARGKNELAGLRLLQNKPEEAKALIEEILKKDAQNTDALLKRAGLRIDAKDYDAAIADLRAALVNQPDSYQAKLLMGAAFERKGDVALAESQMTQALIDSKNDSSVAAVFADFLVRHNNYRRAQEVLTQSLAAHPDAMENLRRLAGVQLIQQDWRGAEETAKRMQALSDDEPAVKRILGAAYAGLKDYDGAIAALTEAQSEAPLATRPLATLVAAYIEDGRAADAETMLQNMIGEDSKNFAARLMLAQTQQAQQKHADAEATLRAAMEKEPARVEAAEALYRIYRASNRIAEAETMLDSQIAANPSIDGYKMLKADLLIGSGRSELSLPIYKDVLARRPNDLLAANNYASLLIELRTDPESRREALAAAKVLEAQDNPFFQDTLAWAKHHNGDSAGAAEMLEKAAAAAPNAAELQYHLGAALLAVGRTDEARAALERAIASGGDAPYVQKARDLLAQN